MSGHADVVEPRDEQVEVAVGLVHLEGHLRVPAAPIGIVLFAHGSGSSRLSPRNRAVADVLHEARLATLLFDLLTPGEYDEGSHVFDIDLLMRRLLGASDWVRGRPGLARVPLGYFGASTGAAAALAAAAEWGEHVGAIVSRGGRPDLAADWLGDVDAATLFIVGELDTAVLDLTRRAQRAMACETDLLVVTGAGHLFEETGSLEQVASAARDWFTHHLPRAGRWAAG